MESKANIIIKKAKDELIDFIRYEAELLSSIGREETEDDYKVNVIDTERLIRVPKVEVEVNDTYEEEYYTEEVAMESIVFDSDGNIAFIFEEVDVEMDELSVEELKEIADILQETYERL